MADAFVVLVLIALGGGSDPASAAITDGLRSGLPKDAVVLLHETAGMPDDVEALSLGETVHASMVVEVVWVDVDHTHAHVHLHRVGRAEWIDHELSFAPDEPLAERGRAVGFDVAAMVPMIESTSKPPPAPIVAPIVPRPAPIPSPTPSPSLRWALDAAFLGRFGVGGSFDELGGELGARVSIDRWLVRVAASEAVGRVADADTRTTRTSATLGAGFVLLRSSLEIAARIDLRATHLDLTRGDVEHARWIGVCAARLELAGWIGGRVALWAAIGPDVAFGRTSLVVAGREAAVVPQAEMGAEVGARFRF